MADVTFTSRTSSLVSRIGNVRGAIGDADERLVFLVSELDSLAKATKTIKEDSINYNELLSEDLKTLLALTLEDCFRVVDRILTRVEELVNSSRNDGIPSSPIKLLLFKAKAIFSGAHGPSDIDRGLKKKVDLWVKDGTMMEAEEKLATKKNTICTLMELVSIAILGGSILPLLRAHARPEL